MSQASTKKKESPQLRFQEFSGDWQLLRVGSFLKERKTYSIKGKGLPHVSLTTRGVIPKSKRYERDFLVRNDEEKKYKITKLNDLCYNPANLKFGVIDINKLGDGIFSPIYVTYEIFNQNIDFIGHLLTQKSFINKARRYEQGTVYERTAVSPSDFEKVNIFLPDTAEQSKISTFLDEIDALHKNLKKQKKTLETYKRGIMQKIFSQEVRLKDKSGKDFPDWQTVIMKDIFTKRSVRNTDSLVKNVLTNSATKGIVNQRDYFEKDIANQENLSSYYVVETDDFVYNPRISSTAPVGPLKRNKNNRGAMSPLYTVLSLKKGDLGFYEHYFNTNLWHRYMFKISNFGARHDRMNIRDTDFMNMPIPFPSEAEQKKIADFINSLDTLVQVRTEQLEKAGVWKRGLLQKMFV